MKRTVFRRETWGKENDISREAAPDFERGRRATQPASGSRDNGTRRKKDCKEAAPPKKKEG